MIKPVTIIQTLRGAGFTPKPEIQRLPGVIFENGKVAYLDKEEVICAAESEQLLLRALKKEPRCIDAQIEI